MKRTLLMLAGLALFVSCRHERTATTYPGAPVIIISIDTLRADHLPAYGYHAVETPAIDALRKDSILFENAWSQVPLTLPSHVSMLTGLLPPANGVRNNLGYRFDAAQHLTLPALLKKHGYATGAAVSAYVLRGGSGLRDAFDSYDDAMEVKAGQPQGMVQRSGDVSEASAVRWIDANGDKPFFFMLHLYEPHAPYAPPEPYRSRFALPYDGEIATADAIVGRFIEHLRARKLYDRAIIVLMSDHGEGLSQHGEPEHGIFLYREDLHVPLLLKLPGSARAATSVKAPAALIDIFPTVASLLGFDTPKLDGSSLLDLDTHPARALYSETLYPRIHLGWSELRSLVDDRHHFISAPRPELFDLANDTQERTNVLDRERRTYASMRDALAKYGSDIQAPSNVDPEEARKLAALGYLSASPATPQGALPDPKDRIGEIAMMGQATRHEAEGDHAAAIAAFQEVLRQNPALADAWSLLAQSQEKSGRDADAIASYKKAIQAAPSLAGENALSIASLALKLRQFDDAETHAHLAERANPAEAHLILGRIALAKHQLPQAENEARLAAAATPGNSHAQLLLAQVLVEQKRFDEATRIIDDVARAAEAGKPVPMLDFVRGDILARQQHFTEAAAAFQREIAHFPTERQPYGNLAVMYYFAGQPELARRTMESLIRAQPDRSSYAFAAETFDEIGASDLAKSFRARSK
jgi:arylsulfatase A-like enzyme/Tfp pilus assembly protein PilF